MEQLTQKRLRDSIALLDGLAKSLKPFTFDDERLKLAVSRIEDAALALRFAAPQRALGAGR